jgi:hypothetical protein
MLKKKFRKKKMQNSKWVYLFGQKGTSWQALVFLQDGAPQPTHVATDRPFQLSSAGTIASSRTLCTGTEAFSAFSSPTGNSERVTGRRRTPLSNAM